MAVATTPVSRPPINETAYGACQCNFPSNSVSQDESVCMGFACVHLMFCRCGACLRRCSLICIGFTDVPNILATTIIVFVLMVRGHAGSLNGPFAFTDSNYEVLDIL